MKTVLESQGLEEEEMMGKETAHIMYDRATIVKALKLSQEAREKIQQAMALQDELAGLLYSWSPIPRGGKTIVPSIPGIEDRRWHTFETEEKKSVAKLTQPESYAIRTYMNYGFCNSADTTLRHIRRMTDGGRTLINTRSLCDERVTWNVYTPLLVAESNTDYNVCLQCAVMYRRELGEQYHANKETDQHKQEG